MGEKREGREGERKEERDETTDQLEAPSLFFFFWRGKSKGLTLVDGVNLNGGVDELGDELLSKIL